MARSVVLLSQFRLALAVLLLLALPQARADSHSMSKRQVGVLARTGALPQGKRSVEALARNGELPVTSHSQDKRDTNNDYILDLLIQELAAAEGLSRLHLQALTERLLQQREESAAQQDNSLEIPQKRDSRTGYLVKAAAEPNDAQRDLLDPEDFLGRIPQLGRANQKSQAPSGRRRQQLRPNWL